MTNARPIESLDIYESRSAFQIEAEGIKVGRIVRQHSPGLEIYTGTLVVPHGEPPRFEYPERGRLGPDGYLNLPWDDTRPIYSTVRTDDDIGSNAIIGDEKYQRDWVVSFFGERFHEVFAEQVVVPLGACGFSSSRRVVSHEDTATIRSQLVVPDAERATSIAAHAHTVVHPHQPFSWKFVESVGQYTHRTGGPRLAIGQAGIGYSLKHPFHDFYEHFAGAMAAVVEHGDDLRTNFSDTFESAKEAVRQKVGPIASDEWVSAFLDDTYERDPQEFEARATALEILNPVTYEMVVDWDIYTQGLQAGISSKLLGPNVEMNLARRNEVYAVLNNAALEIGLPDTSTARGID